MAYHIENATRVVTWFAQTRPATRVLQFFTNVCQKDPVDTHHVLRVGQTVFRNSVPVQHSA